MKLYLFILLFLTGVKPCVQSVVRKYYLIQDWTTWSDAQAYCRANYTDLATIEGSSDITQLQTEATSQQFSYFAWIGFYTNTSAWRWSLGNQPLGNVTDWYSVLNYKEPNNANGHEECCAFNPQGWFDRVCQETFAFVCFDDRKNGTERYIHYPTLLSWSDARSYCRQNHTDLASSRDATENSILKGIIPSSSEYNWFGLFRNGWMWSDGNNSSFMNWAQGNPLGMDDCVEIYNGACYNVACSVPRPFFCEAAIYPRKQQSIRMKFQSSKDLNNPTVMQAIMEKIQQVLKDHGVTVNTTLKWRKNSEDVVFHKDATILH